MGLNSRSLCVAIIDHNLSFSDEFGQVNISDQEMY